VSAVQLFAVTGAHGHQGRVGRLAEVVAFRDLAAVVADAPYAVPGLEGLPVYRDVVESVFREQAVLPAPPGVVFRDRDVLMQWMELHYFTLLDALAFVEDRAVARVAVAPVVPAVPVPAGPGPAAEPAEPAEPAGGAEEEAARREASEAVLRDALRVLRRHAVASIAVGGDGSYAAAASFLVERTRWDLFAGVVRQENERLTDFSLRLSGPWPPYDFVRMQFTN
jgi:hypothetical protein